MLYYQLARGIRKSSPVVEPAAINTTYNLFLISAGRTVIIRKIMGYNGQAAGAVITIGLGALGAGIPANIIPNIILIAGFDSEWEEVMIPEVEVNANIVYSSTVATGAVRFEVQLQIEVEEIYI